MGLNALFGGVGWLGWLVVAQLRGFIGGFLGGCELVLSLVLLIGG